MKEISVKIEGEEADFYWKDGKSYCPGYDLDSERTALALTGFGEGIGVLLVAVNDCCKSEAEFRSEIKKFIDGHERVVSREYLEWPEGQLLFEYYSYSPDLVKRWGGVFGARLSQRHYKRMLKDPEMRIKAMMASLEGLPLEYFHALAGLSDYWVNYNLSDNEQCPSAVLEVLSRDEEPWPRRNVAQHLNCPVRILEVLSEDEDNLVRQRVAGNLAVPQEILKIRGKDKIAEVRQCVATNPNCPIEILELLSHDEDIWIRQCVAENPACPERILEILSEDKEASVRSSATKNRNCSQSILDRPVQDKNKSVLLGAQANLAKSRGMGV